MPPGKGRILFDGVDSATLSRLEIARMIGYVRRAADRPVFRYGLRYGHDGEKTSLFLAVQR